MWNKTGDNQPWEGFYPGMIITGMKKHVRTHYSSADQNMFFIYLTINE